MIVAIHQPNYFPWLGYFHKVLHSDAFVLLDHVQFSRSSYTSRVQVLCQGQPLWLSVPVLKSGRFGQPISETQCDPRGDWKARHLKTLRANYAKHPHFGEVFGMVEDLLHEPGCNLAHVNDRVVRGLSGALGARCRFVRSSELDLPDAHRNEMLVDVVRAVGGDRYLFGAGGATYQQVGLFEQAGIALRPQAFRHPVYPQHRGGEFVPGLSVLDALFNVGLEGTRALLAGPPGDG